MLKKVDVIIIRRMFEKLNVNDMDWEDLSTELSGSADDYEEKGNDEKAEAYTEVSEAIVNFVEAYRELYSTLEEHEIVEA